MIQLGKEDWGYRWGVYFLKTDALLKYEERMELVKSAVEMYAANEKQRTLKTETYEGVMKTDSRYVSAGIFGGRRYTATIDVGDKRANLEFLIQERINPQLN